MREIMVSTDVYARIWGIRAPGEDTEDAILQRVLFASPVVQAKPPHETQSGTTGLVVRRFGVIFEEGFTVFRTYLGRDFEAAVKNGQWEIKGQNGRFSRLNELSRAIGTKTENAWKNWFYTDEDGKRLPVSDLRDPREITTRSRKEKKGMIQESYTTTNSAHHARWCDDVQSALKDLGGRATLSQIYSKVRDIRRVAGRSTPVSLEEVVRKELEIRSSDSDAYDSERGEDWFKMAEGKGLGVWALRTRDFS